MISIYKHDISKYIWYVYIKMINANINEICKYMCIYIEDMYIYIDGMCKFKRYMYIYFLKYMYL